jgi:hypothetical protein
VRSSLKAMGQKRQRQRRVRKGRKVEDAKVAKEGKGWLGIRRRRAGEEGDGDGEGEDGEDDAEGGEGADLDPVGGEHAGGGEGEDGGQAEVQEAELAQHVGEQEEERTETHDGEDVRGVGEEWVAGDGENGGDGVEGEDDVGGLDGDERQGEHGEHGDAALAGEEDVVAEGGLAASARVMPPMAAVSTLPC